MISLFSTSILSFSGFTLDDHGCVTDYSATVDYFPPERRAIMNGASTASDTYFGSAGISATMAQDFTIEYHRTFKVLNNLRSGKTYVLRQCGTPEVIPDLPASLADATVFEVPVKKWATAGSVNMGYLAELGLASKAGAVNANYFSSPCIHKLIDCDVVQTMATTSYPAPDYTAVTNPDWIAADADVFFTDNFGTGATGTAKDVTVDASQDPGLLHRAEWVKFFAAFFNTETAANRKFAEIQTEFETVSATAKALPAQPRVAHVEYGAASAWGPESIKIKMPAYMIEAVEMAGGTPNDPATNAPANCTATLNWDGSPGDDYQCSTMEAMREFLKGADYVIDTSSSYGLCPEGGAFCYDITHFLGYFGLDGASAADYPFLANGVIRLDKRQSNNTDFGGPGAIGDDWFESQLSQPSLTIHDVAAIIHPDAFPGYTTRWMRNLVKGEVAEVVSKGECTDPYAVCSGETAPTKSVYAAAAEIANECIGDMCALSKDTGGILDESISVYKTWLDGQSPTPSPPPPPPSAAPSPPPTPSPPPQVLEVEVERQVEVPSTTLSSEVLAAIIAPIAALALALMCILVMVIKERSGTPMFSTLAVEAEPKV
jgi:hypothetical protein